VGVNGKRGVVIDLNLTNPAGWAKDISPSFNRSVDAIIYELHVRDASIHANSGIVNKGKFLGLAETGTKTSAGLSTGLDHIKELGVTHLHLLPSFDFFSIDESSTSPKYNWGYDPQNYNVPEGSYSTNPYDGITRIKEFKTMVMALHKNGLRVVMDVVYNHTAQTQQSNFNQIAPGYYYRFNPDGTFSNGSACGNETASDRPMMRKFMIESLKYWVQEYHIDGFRFDLMGIHDIETMNLISEELQGIKPDILLYGEGWTAGNVQIKPADQAVKANAAKLNNIAVFSDDIRDGIKGSVFEHQQRGFATGLADQAESVKFGVVASCQHPQVDNTKVKYAKNPYASAPHNTITYCECHDNHVLWDRLSMSMPNSSESERKNMHKLALSIVLTSQGISFLHAGTEFLRSKQGVENSFESPDEINAIDWSLKEKNRDVFEYVKLLIDMRKKHAAFRMVTSEQLAENLKFIEDVPENIVAYTINGEDMRDKWKRILVIYNGSGKAKNVEVPDIKWRVFIKDNQKSKGLAGASIAVAPYSCSILYR
jgi:pullulanase